MHNYGTDSDFIVFGYSLCLGIHRSQIRLDELKATFGDRVAIEPHFVTVFGDTHTKLEDRWRDSPEARLRQRGGLQGYSNHVKESVKKFTHVTIHPDLWTQNIPASSISCHVFLQAVKLLKQQSEIESSAGMFDKTIWAIRQAFLPKPPM